LQEEIPKVHQREEIESMLTICVYSATTKCFVDLEMVELTRDLQSQVSIHWDALEGEGTLPALQREGSRWDVGEVEHREEVFDWWCVEVSDGLSRRDAGLSGVSTFAKPQMDG
jgi:hypothetical protein